MRGYVGFLRATLKVPLSHARRRPRPVRGLDLRHVAAADRLHARRGHLARRRLGRVAAGRDARGHARHHRPDGRSPQDHSRSRAACSSSAAARPRAASRCARPRCSSIWCRNRARPCRKRQIKTIISDKLADIPDTRAWYVNERGERELSFSMLSHSGEDLDGAVRKLEGALRQVPGFKNVAADAAIDRPELRVVPKFDAAAASALPRARSPRRSASPPSATSTPTSPSSTPATAWSRSVCRSTRTPAPTCSGCRTCA